MAIHLHTAEELEDDFDQHIGDDMNYPTITPTTRRWIAPLLTTVALTGLVAPVAGAAERVVLGEYFTNLR